MLGLTEVEDPFLLGIDVISKLNRGYSSAKQVKEVQMRLKRGREIT
jgi:hypothetical protein